MFGRACEAPVATIEPGITRQVLCHDAQLMMVRVTFAKDAVGALHQHPHRQVTYVEAGVFETTIDGHTTRLVAGDAFLVPPGALHGVVALDAGSLIDVFTPARHDFLV